MITHAYGAGELVHIRVARPHVQYKCGCRAPLIPVQGRHISWHYRHLHETACDGETLLHETVKRAVLPRDIYGFECGCRYECSGSYVRTERSVVPGTVSDAVVYDDQDRPVCIVEVVVSHDISERAAEAYAKSGLSVIRLYPAWDAADPCGWTARAAWGTRGPCGLCAIRKRAARPVRGACATCGAPVIRRPSPYNPGRVTCVGCVERGLVAP